MGIKYVNEVFNPLMLSGYYSIICSKSYYSVTAKNYSVTTVKLIQILYSYDNEECMAGPNN